MATRISISPLAENNLVRNNCFGQKLSFFRYEGSGSAEVLNGPPAFCRFSGGTLFHLFDIDNQEHAFPESVFPYRGSYVFKFRARGKGKLKGGIRWRISRFRGDTDPAICMTPAYELEEEFREYIFEGTVSDHLYSVNDRLFWEVEGFADITGISFFYRIPREEVTFDKPHIVALPGEKFTFKCRNAEKLICCYGHCSNELSPEIINAPGKITQIMPPMDGEGMRFVGIGNGIDSRKSLFVSTPAPGIAARMRKCRFDTKPRHLLFFGDSLTAYDAGRNYTDIAGSFLPESWSYTNAGIGGDDLPRLVKRLQGRPRTYRLEDFSGIWEKTPDEIFLFYGANDSKASFLNNFTAPGTPPEKEEKLLHEIFEIFRDKAPEARVTVISAAPGFFPYQLECSGRLKAQGIQHNLFGIPEHVKNFNRTAKKFASEKGWNYLDFHKRCMRHADLQSLFIPDDGVHMTLKGHQFLALQLLEYLQK